MSAPLAIRLATLADVDRLRELQVRSMREFKLAGPRGVEANAKHHTIRIGPYEVRPRALDAVGGGTGV
jgi:hypothetical protein